MKRNPARACAVIDKKNSRLVPFFITSLALFAGCLAVAENPRTKEVIPEKPDATALAEIQPQPAGRDNEKKWLRENYASVSLQNFRQQPLFLERIDFNNIDYPRLDAAIFYATNEIRVKSGLSFLPYAEQLERAAWNHARRMVEKNFFSHTDSTDSRRRTTGDRAKLAGIANPFLAENIATGFGIAYAAGKSVFPIPGKPGSFSYTSGGPLIPAHTYLSFADDILKNWMGSSGHKANILSKNALALGCGAYYYADKNFYHMPMFKAVQNFQWFHGIRPGPATDPAP